MKRFCHNIFVLVFVIFVAYMTRLTLSYFIVF